jgi:hypothetical protein
VGYSYSDLAGVFNPATDSLLGRLSVIQGIYPYDYTQFNLRTNLGEFKVLYDAGLNNAGPTVIPFFQSDNGVITDPGAGLTILLSPPVITLNGHTGTPQVNGLITASSIQVPLYGVSGRPGQAIAPPIPASNAPAVTDTSDPGLIGGGEGGLFGPGGGTGVPTSPGGSAGPSTPAGGFTPGTGAGGAGGVHGGPGALSRG